MVLVAVGPGFELREAVDEGVADGVGVEVGDVEDFDAGFLENGAVEGCAGVCEIRQSPD